MAYAFDHGLFAGAVDDVKFCRAGGRAVAFIVLTVCGGESNRVFPPGMSGRNHFHSLVGPVHGGGVRCSEGGDYRFRG